MSKFDFTDLLLIFFKNIPLLIQILSETPYSIKVPELFDVNFIWRSHKTIRARQRWF